MSIIDGSEAWPCTWTRIAWLARGIDEEAEVRKVLDASKQEMDAEQIAWEESQGIPPEESMVASRRRNGAPA